MTARFDYHKPGTTIREAGLKILEILEQHQYKKKTLYLVRHLCHEGGEPEELLHTQIATKMRYRRTLCKRCGLALAGKVVRPCNDYVCKPPLWDKPVSVAGGFWVWGV